ncbi:MAG: glycoside hydrolase family 57 [Planctomycetota bacterium]|nr:glycoside hydrolase family 57 [Planctomycetota bacterium]
MALRGTLLFHLNLSYSSVPVEDRGEILRRCYRPMLALLDELPWLVLAVEAGAHTLERARELDPGWLESLRRAIDAGRVELVGSGDTQLIGPLVPADVHRWNQELGVRAYKELLGVRPTTALVNEMAWSQGIVDGYLDAGYETLVMEWNNPRRNHPTWNDEWRYGLSWSKSPRGRRIAVAWADAIAFQKFQRAVTGDLAPDAYRAWVAQRRADRPRHLFLYASDAEVFDFRPGRFRTEPELLAEGEWRRMAGLLRALHADGLEFTTPSRLRSDPAFRPGPPVVLGSAADPIPVKKQPKYNVTRWALSGWDDVGLNSRCFARARELLRVGTSGGSPADWRALCRAWASDRRTHLTPARWEATKNALPESEAAECPQFPRFPQSIDPRPPRARLARSEVQRRGDLLFVDTDGVRLALNLRRGLAIESLAFAATGWESLLGTLHHGYFDDIHWAADFYSGHVIAESPAQGRVTDLERVEPEVDRRDDAVTVLTEVPTPLGALPKRVTVHADRVEVACDLSRWGARPLGSLRAGHVTLNPEAFGPELAVTCAHGGAPERFALDGSCDQGRSVSLLVSASAAFGATDGTLALDDGRHRLTLAWDPGRAAALPLLSVRDIDGRRMVRVAFSLSEVDDTHRPGAPLYDFAFSITAEELSK